MAEDGETAIDPIWASVYVAVGTIWRHEASRSICLLIRYSLELRTGRLKWYFSKRITTWDFDSGGPPTLFDMQVRGHARGAGRGAEQNDSHILNRETGQPVRR